MSESGLLSSQYKIKHKEFSLLRQTFALTIGAVVTDYPSFPPPFISQSTFTQSQIDKEERHSEDTKTTAPTWTAEIHCWLSHWLSSTHPGEPEEWRHFAPQSQHNINKRWTSSSSSFSNLCRNNVLAPILQSLLRCSSHVAPLPLNIGHVRRRSSEKIKRQAKCLDSWMVWIISAWHTFPLFPFVDSLSFFSLPSTHLINMLQKMMFSLSRSLIQLLWECKFTDTKAHIVWLAGAICSFGCFYSFLSNDRVPWEPDWAPAEMNHSERRRL